MTLAAFIGIALIHLAAVVSPGPSFVVTVRTAAAEGLRPALGVALGLGTGAIVWAIAALLGLAVLFEYAPVLLTALKVLGGIFLIYIAWKTWTHADDQLSDVGLANQPPRDLLSAIRLGLLTQFANPKPALFYGAVFIGLVPPEASPLAITGLLTLIFAQELIWFGIVARFFSLAKPRRAYGRMKPKIDRLFGGLIALFGAKIALT